MLLSLGTIFIMGVFSINPISSGSILRHYLLLKNCTHIGVRVEVVFEFKESLNIFLTRNNDLIRYIGIAGFNNLNKLDVYNEPIDVETLIVLGECKDINVDSINVTVFVKFAENNDTYQLNLRFQTNPSIPTDIYRKARCSPLDQSTFCENHCLCDTPIYKLCYNQNITGKCSDPGTLFDSPGILTFDGKCSQETTTPATETTAPETTKLETRTPTPEHTTPEAEPLSYRFIGIAIGVIAGVAIIGLLVYLIFKRNGKKRLISREVSNSSSQ